MHCRYSKFGSAALCIDWRLKLRVASRLLYKVNSCGNFAESFFSDIKERSRGEVS